MSAQKDFRLGNTPTRCDTIPHMLLENGQIERAEAVFRKDLSKNAKNPWSLFGLTQCLRKAG